MITLADIDANLLAESFKILGYKSRNKLTNEQKECLFFGAILLATIREEEEKERISKGKSKANSSQI